jgi:hypothetical protein
LSVPEQTREKWSEWLAQIRQEVYDLHLNHHVFHRVRRFGLENPAFREKAALGTNVFWVFLHHVFTHYAAMAVRRQCEIDKQVVSLGRLLNELAESPEFIRRDEFVAASTSPFPNLEEASRKEAEKFFDHFAPDGAAEPEPLVVMLDLETLRAAAEQAKTFADRRVAHFDKRETAYLGDLSDLDEPVECLRRLTARYHRLVRREELDLALPVVVDSHLQLLLRDPWNTHSW